MVRWLLLQDGKATWIEDTNPSGKARPFWPRIYPVKTIRLGFIESSHAPDYFKKFVEGEPTPKDSPIIVFELDVGKREKEYFY